MSSLTRIALVTAGMRKAGRSAVDEADLADNMREGLDNWLRSMAQAWPWTQLKERKTGLACATGAQFVLFGNGQGGEALQVSRILDPIFIGTSDYGTRSRARIKQLTGGGPDGADLDFDESINNPATWRGLPQNFKLRINKLKGWGEWKMIPIPFPDRDYILSFDYIFVPADLGVGTGNDLVSPWYPNDRTIIQAIKTECLQHIDGEDSETYMKALEILGGMVVDDRVKYGMAPGDNDLIQLDPDVFR